MVFVASVADEKESSSIAARISAASWRRDESSLCAATSSRIHATLLSLLFLLRVNLYSSPSSLLAFLDTPNIPHDLSKTYLKLAHITIPAINAANAIPAILTFAFLYLMVSLLDRRLVLALVPMCTVSIFILAMSNVTNRSIVISISHLLKVRVKHEIAAWRRWRSKRDQTHSSLMTSPPDNISLMLGKIPHTSIRNQPHLLL